MPLKTTRMHTKYQAKIEWVPVAKCRTEPGAQRAFVQAWADKIAAEFDPDLIGFPFVAAHPDEDDVFVIIDGQHRIDAVKKALGIDQLIECEVVRGVSIARAAQLYRGRNAIRLPRPVDLFIAGVKGGVAECVAIEQIVRKAGLRIAGHATGNAVACVSALQHIYRLDTSGKILGRALAIGISAWGLTAEATQGNFLEGLALMLRRDWDSIDDEALARNLAGTSGGSAGVMGHARTLKAAMGGGIVVNVWRQLVTVYNKKRHKNLLADVDVRRTPSAPKKKAATRKPVAGSDADTTVRRLAAQGRDE